MNNKGLTLIELMITLAVISILIAAGLPRLQNMSKGNRMTTTINRLVSDIAFAKTEAINRNASISIVANATDGWNGGWQVQTNNGTALRVAGAIHPTLNITGSATTITYRSTGMKSETSDITLKFCRAGESVGGKQINLNAVGRAHTVTTGISCP